MKQLIYSWFLISLFGCGPRMYTYKFSLQESKKPRQLYYEDDTISLSFNFFHEGLLVNFENKSTQVARIDWDKLKMTRNDTAKEMTHLMINEDREFYFFQPPGSVAPNGKLADLLVFSDHVSYIINGDEEKVNIRDMYPRETRNRDRAAIDRLVGQKITLTIPFDFDNVSRPKNFHFTLVRIRSRRMFEAFDALIFFPPL